MPDTQLPTQITPSERLLTAERFQRLADVPPEVEWFANIRNASTRRAYENAIRDFMGFSVLQAHTERSSSWTDQSCG
jgi:integrase/recombinase XerD